MIFYNIIMKNHLSLRVLQWLLYACALIPLFISSQFMSPFHFGKVLLFRSMVEVMVVLYLVVIWQNPAHRPRFTPVHWAFLAFTISFFIATLTSFNTYQSFWGTLERMGGWWTFLHYFVFFVILTSIFRSKEQWFTLINITILSGVLSALYGFGQKTSIDFFIGSGNRARIFGTIGNPALFAGYQLLALFLALMMFIKEGTMSRKRWYLIAATMMIIATLMTVVRGSLLALGVGLLLFAWLWLRETNSQMAKRSLVGLITAAAAFIAFAILFKDSSLVENSSFLRRLTEFSLKSFTVQTRFWAWQVGLQGWQESIRTILLGWGPENFNYPFAKYFNPQFFRGLGSETLFDRAHNMFVEVLVTMGVIGLIAYLSVFVSAFKSLWSILKKKGADALMAVGLIPLVVAYIIHNSFIFDTSPNFITFFSILGFIAFLSFPQAEADKLNSTRSLSGFKKLLVGVLSIVVLIVIYDTNISPASANFITTRAILKSWSGDFSGAVAKYKEAISYEVAGKYEFRHRFAQYVLEYTVSKQLTPEMKEALETSLVSVKKNIQENPHDYLPYLYASRINITLGRDDPKSPYNDEALKYSNDALKLAPTFVRTYYEIGQAYLNKKDFNEAAKYFQKAVELNPEVGLSYWYLGIVEYEKGDIQKAIKTLDTAFEKGYNVTETDYNRLINIYLKANDFNRIVIVYEKLIEKNPNDPQYYASLAVSYARIGQIDKAVAAARRAAEIDPAFTAEAKAFVNSLGRQF